MRFLTSVLFTSAIMALFVRWARRQSEQQIDKMQDAVFNSPGVEAPVPPRVLVVGIGVLIGLWLIDRKVLKLKRWQTLSALLTGGAGGVFAIISGRGIQS